MLTVNKKIQALVILFGSFFLNVTVLAANPAAGAAASNTASSNSSEQTLREVIQDLKNFLGVSNLKNVETQNVMRLMYPPFIDVTMGIGSRIAAAEEVIPPWQETLLRDTANYDINTTEKEASDTTFLTSRIDQAKAAGNVTGANVYTDPYVGLNDLLASTLLNGLAFKSNEQAENAYHFIQRLTNARPLVALTEDEMFADPPYNTTLSEKGGKHLMQVYKQLPLMTLAQNSLLAIHSEKQRFKEFNQGLPIGDKDEGASLMEVMAYEVERRYMNADWYNEMNQMSEAGLLREIANILAFQSYQNFKSYEQGQRMEALMAGQAGAMSGLFGDLNIGAMPEVPDLTTVPMP